MRLLIALAPIVFACPAMLAGAEAETATLVDPADRTANMPDSWLVLYNVNSTVSLAWRDWYLGQWDIPIENALGLDVSTAERILFTEFEARILNPVQAHLAAHPDLASRIMGIIVGYGVPGNCYASEDSPPLQSGGGWSIASNLQDLSSSTWFRRPNPVAFVAYASTKPQLTKATLPANIYLSARIDGPDIGQAAGLTGRARAISLATGPVPETDKLHYDFEDIGAPAGDNWLALKYATERPLTSSPEWFYPWHAFESETDTTPDCALRFCYYRVTGWELVDFGGDPPGTRILGMAYNSWGATTVRSTTAHNGRYVPNALFRGGFAVAVGATAEPWTGTEPSPGTIVYGLSQGWTVAEAVCRATPHVNHMWEMVGDPLLRVPLWFAEPVNLPPDPPGNLGPTAWTDGSASANDTPTFTFEQSDPNGDELSFDLQVATDNGFNTLILDYVSAPGPAGPAQFTVGQPEGTGVYAVGAPGQLLPPGSYYWRVRSMDAEDSGDWSQAGDSGSPAFVIVEPLELVSAVSRKTHGGAGIFDLPITIGTGSPTKSEPRCQGPNRIVITFSRPVKTTDGFTPGSEVLASAGVVDQIDLIGNEAVVRLSAVPNATCVQLAVVGISDIDNLPLAGENVLRVIALIGDVNGNGFTNYVDTSAIKALAGLSVNQGNFCHDLNTSGFIDFIDLSMSKELAGLAASCP